MGRRERQIEKRKQIWMAGILVFLMIASGFGVIIGNQSNELKYGKFKFVFDENNKYPNERYISKINNIEVPFFFLPQETDYINLSSTITNKIKESFFLMTSYDSDALSLQDIARTNFHLSTYLFDTGTGNKVVYMGVLDSTFETIQPEITCANATLKTPVIIFNETDFTSIVDVDNCIYFNAKGQEFIRLRDRIIYAYHGVIENE